jgi:diguanylate cyclase (GGDEF)-like protein
LPQRSGGEEIAILLPNTTAEEAALFAERLRNGIESSAHSAKGLRITASFGVASVPQHAKDTKEIVEMADTALYRAKQLGRNKVILAKTATG